MSSVSSGAVFLDDFEHLVALIKFYILKKQKKKQDRFVEIKSSDDWLI